MHDFRRLAIALLLLTLPTQAQPQDYNFISQFGKPCRLRASDLPWQVYNSGGHSEVLRYVVSVYNSEARRLGQTSFFEITTVRSAAHLTVDWSGLGLPSNRAGGVFWDAGIGYKRVLGLSMDGAHRVPKGNRAQILMQELGHVLGLGDSKVRSDIMHPIMHTQRYYRFSQVQLTNRDRAALAWLYSRTEWVPILGQGQTLKEALPQPSFTPIP